jgi:DNA sulfur modification protein DndC
MFDYSALLFEIQGQYLADKIPWVIGYSGGKDSTALLQMVFYALSDLPKAKLNKDVHVLSNDTLVENPAIVKYVNKQLGKIEKAGKQNLFRHNPDLFQVIRVTPKLEESFWVSLIGKGYPSPNRWFRWCTERLKINPTSDYILTTVNRHGKAIIVLGTRKAESANRAASMINHNNGDRLRKHELPNAFVYAPIADLSNHEVWAYLLQAPNPWGSNNRSLLALYKNACNGRECPFVIETGTQSCGKSRFGCWVCTVVDKDRSMENFIDNGEEWMEELLEFRNWLYDIRQQTSQYVPVRFESKVKFGAFLLKVRYEILDKLLKMQDHMPVELITPDELNYVRELLEKESVSRVKDGLKKFVYQLLDGRCVTTISDFNILLTPRKRLAAMSFDRARLIDTKSVASDYLKSTRVMYYWA